MIKTEYMTFTCQYCGKEFQRTAREYRRTVKINRPIKYCSRECANKGRDTRVEKSCPVCGKTFLVQGRLSNQNLSCSPECAQKRREKAHSPITIICKGCNKEFTVESSYYTTQEKRGQKVNFCSKECQNKYLRRNMIKLRCIVCGKEFLKNKEKISENGNCCSLECRRKVREQHKHKVKCEYCNKEIIINEYRFIYTKKHFCNMECKKKYIFKEKDKYRDLAHYLRSTINYEKWRDSVFKRDNYRCTECGAKSNLHVHHKEPLYKIVKKYNFITEDIINSKEFNDISNGIVVCSECHNKIHPFVKRNEKGQFMPLWDKDD